VVAGRGRKDTLFPGTVNECLLVFEDKGRRWVRRESMFRKERFLIGLVLLLAASCASTDLRTLTAASYEGAGEIMENSVNTYLRLQPKLTPVQQQEFKEQYAAICKSYQTAGILLDSATDAADAASAHTAVISYRRTIAELPNMINRLSQLVQSFGKATGK
jgi:hypothetical protein